MFHFLSGRGKLPAEQLKQIQNICERHDVTFVNVNLPGDGWAYWATARNRGFPFDRDLERTVVAALHAAQLRL